MGLYFLFLLIFTRPLLCSPSSLLAEEAEVESNKCRVKGRHRKARQEGSAQERVKQKANVLSR